MCVCAVGGGFFLASSGDCIDIAQEREHPVLTSSIRISVVVKITSFIFQVIVFCCCLFTVVSYLYGNGKDEV